MANFSSKFLVASALLIAQGAGFYVLTMRGEAVPTIQPLSVLPKTLSEWRLAQELPVEKDVQDVLKASDVLSRWYTGPGGGAALFVAYFKSQRSGVAPHSPKNCLPGNGFVPLTVDRLSINVPGFATPIDANRYIVQRGDSKSVVIYWYQSRERTVASEYTAKAYVVADALRYNRTDTSLVKVTIPYEGNHDDEATKMAINFIQSFYSPLRGILPS